MDFILKEPNIKEPEIIEKLSLETILEEAKGFERFNEFTFEEQKVLQRMIHSTTCFEQIINNILFKGDSTVHIKQLLQNGASIITDTNMIKAGISKVYTEKYGNNVICYVSEPDVKSIANKEGITRTAAAVKKALNKIKNTPAILACGNAPTFLYAAIETLINEKWDLKNIAILAMPVGFINVEESKEYALEFMNFTNTSGIVLKGRYGGSPLIVSCLHSIYKRGEDA